MGGGYCIRKDMEGHDSRLDRFDHCYLTISNIHAHRRARLHMEREIEAFVQHLEFNFFP